MSDRVRFLTWNDTATPANSSGANGFPAPFTDGSAGAGHNYYPAIMPFDKLIELYWRVKKFKITATDFTITAGAVTTPVTTATASAPVASTELDLIQQSHFILQDMDVVEVDMFQPALGIKKVGSNLSPPLLIFNGFLWQADDPGVASIRVNFTSDVPFYSPPTGTFNCTFCGFTIPMEYQVATTGSPTSFTLSQLVIDPIEYWPYAASDGSPIYDTATGAQLQSPLN